METVQNLIPFDRLQFRSYSVNKLTRNIIREINGVDTETLNGYCKLIADSTGAYEFRKNITHKYKNLEVILNFLTEKRFRSANNFFYNLNYDVNAIIKNLPEKNLKELYEGSYRLKYNRKTKQKEITYTPHTTEYKEYLLKYIPKKIFQISHKNHVYKFYDVAQFYGGSLEKNAKLYLNKEKYIHLIDGQKIDGAILGTSKEYWNNNLDIIKEYCINDCILTKDLGILLDKTLRDKININTDSYFSKASISKEYIRKFVNVPDIKHVDKSALKYSFNAYNGGRFEVLKRGYVGKCTLYDINSAYPFHIKNLIDISVGKWKRVNSLHESAYYGFYKVKIQCGFNTISPLSFQLKNGTVIYPIMDAIYYMTKQELLEYEKYITYEIITGWEYYPDEIIYPFKDFIEKVYTQKNIVDKENFEYSLWKIIMNGGYGAFYEKNLDKETGQIIVGKLFNPIYATMITSNTRLDLFKTAMPHIKKVVGFATDSILFKGNPNIKTGENLGEWSVEGKPNEKSIVLRSGIYQIGDKMKNRGIKKTKFLKTPHGNYESIFDYIRKKPELSIYPITMNRPLTFIEVLLHHKKHTLKDINTFVDINYNIDINKDYKRIWDSEFICGQEIFEKQINSEPLII